MSEVSEKTLTIGRRVERYIYDRRTRHQFKGYRRQMRPVQGVSYPRSGHAIAYILAKRYFGEAFFYCDTNNKVQCGCAAVPCINPARTFAKNHDFSLRNSEGVPISSSERYLIQFRSPVPSIVSNYYLYRARSLLKYRKSNWIRFAFDSINFWNRFVDKWVLNFPADANSPLFCSYESLISDPQARAREILSYFSPGPLDEEAISSILKRRPVSPRNSISKFKYYDAGFFRELEELTSGRLARLGLPAFNEEG